MIRYRRSVTTQVLRSGHDIGPGMPGASTAGQSIRNHRWVSHGQSEGTQGPGVSGPRGRPEEPGARVCRVQTHSFSST